MMMRCEQGGPQKRGRKIALYNGSEEGVPSPKL